MFGKGKKEKEDLKQKNQELEQENQALRKDNDTLKGRCNAYSEEVEKLKHDKKGLQSMLDLRGFELTEANAKVKTLESENKNQQEKNKNQEELYSSMVQTGRVQTEELLSSRDRIVSLVNVKNGEIEALQKRVAEQNKEIEAGKAEKAKLQAEMESLKKDKESILKWAREDLPKLVMAQASTREEKTRLSRSATIPPTTATSQRSSVPGPAEFNSTRRRSEGVAPIDDAGKYNSSLALADRKISSDKKDESASPEGSKSLSPTI